jgi:phosphatidylglycerol:prolipoprotein diacylglycerol transferase
VYPILLEWGPLVLPAWHTFYVLGALCAFWLLRQLASRHAPELASHELARLYLVCYIAGYFGARLLSIVVEEPDVNGAAATLAALFRFGPMTFYGGAIGAFAGGLAYAKRRRLSFTTLLDLAIPAALLALAFGRIGCFLNGDDYGKPAPLAPDGAPPLWSVTFPVLQDGIARWPVQLLEAGVAAALALFLCLAFGRLRTAFKPGAVGYFGIIGYANARFLLEFLRDDFRGFVFGTWLSTSQFISILVLLACGVTIPLWIRRPS